VLSLLALLGAVTALGSVPLHDGGGSQAVRSHRVVFALGDGWVRYRRDTYVLAVRTAGGLTCRVLLRTRGTLRRRAPRPDFAVAERGTAGTLRWRLGERATSYAAVAHRRAPPSLRTPRRPYVGYAMDLRAESPGQECANAVAKQRGTLRSAIGSIRLTRS
jgi:hypothetical protein